MKNHKEEQTGEEEEKEEKNDAEDLEDEEEEVALPSEQGTLEIILKKLTKIDLVF